MSAINNSAAKLSGDPGELDAFLSNFLPRQVEADAALHDGDAEPRFEIYSRNDPVTVLGALGPCESGWDEVSEVFRWVAARFADTKTFEFELIAAGVSGDLAYTVGYEHSTYSVDGGPPEPKTLRATHVYRREDGEWKIVHRHADYPPPDQRQSAED